MFEAPGGTLSYFAGSQETQQRHSSQCAYYCLDGDLCQMGIMESRLRRAGFNVVRSQSGTYPGFRECDLDEYKRALKYLFDRRVPGWWNQKLIDHGICTQQEYDAALTAECKGKRAV